MKKITPAFNEAGGAPLHDRRRSFHLRMYFQRNQQNAEKSTGRLSTCTGKGISPFGP